MELAALPGSGPASGRIEGRTEGVSDGKVTVRLSSGTTMEVPTTETWPPGTAVALATGSDGMVRIVPLQADAALAQTREAIWKALSELMDSPQTAREVSLALAKGDVQKAAELLIPDPEGKPSALLSKPSSLAPPATPSVVDLLAQIEPGRFQARVAGSSRELWTSSELSSPVRFSAKASLLPDGWALWTPVRSGAPTTPPLPDSVTTDAVGARALLRHGGFPQVPDEVVEDLAAYLRASAERLLDEHAQTTQTAFHSDPQKASNPLDPSNKPIAVAQQQLAPESVDKSKGAPVARLDAATAQRAFVAWALEIPVDHPALASLLGKATSLPQLLEALESRLATKSNLHPALANTLSKTLATGRILPEARSELEARILEAMTSPTASREDQPALADTARTLLGERLAELGRDAALRGELVWTKQETRWETERVVVKDRRKRDPKRSPDHHVAEIHLAPKGAGAIDAKLTLDGRILTVHMEAESTETARNLREHLPELRMALENTGLSVSNLEVAKSDAPTTEASRKTGAGGGFDVRA